MKDEDKKIVGIRPDVEIEDEWDDELVPDENVIEILEIMLESARAGEIVEIGIVSRYFAGDITGNVFIGTPSENTSSFLGEITKLQSRYLAWSEELEELENEYDEGE